MKFYTAQFSQVRYLEPYMIPFSTAAGEPKWFHDGKDRSHTFVDKRGVINGLVAEPLLVDTDEVDRLFDSGLGCSKDCEFKEFVPNCPFMELYSRTLKKQKISDVIHYFDEICYSVKKMLGFKEEPIVILLVYENASIDCAERPVIQNYLKNNGIEVEEWTKDTLTKEKLF